jgi:hypothetical protein
LGPNSGCGQQQAPKQKQETRLTQLQKNDLMCVSTLLFSIQYYCVEPRDIFLAPLSLRIERQNRSGQPAVHRLCAGAVCGANRPAFSIIIEKSPMCPPAAPPEGPQHAVSTHRQIDLPKERGWDIFLIANLVVLESRPEGCSETWDVARIASVQGLDKMLFDMTKGVPYLDVEILLAPHPSAIVTLI